MRHLQWNELFWGANCSSLKKKNQYSQCPKKSKSTNFTINQIVSQPIYHVISIRRSLRMHRNTKTDTEIYEFCSNKQLRLACPARTWTVRIRIYVSKQAVWVYIFLVGFDPVTVRTKGRTHTQINSVCASICGFSTHFRHNELVNVNTCFLSCQSIHSCYIRSIFRPWHGIFLPYIVLALSPSLHILFRSACVCASTYYLLRGEQWRSNRSQCFLAVRQTHAHTWFGPNIGSHWRRVYFLLSMPAVFRIQWGSPHKND